MDTHKFPVTIEQDEDGRYVATVPSLNGCHTQAESLEVLITRIREAIELYLDCKNDEYVLSFSDRYASHPACSGNGAMQDMDIRKLRGKFAGLSSDGLRDEDERLNTILEEEEFTSLDDL